MTTLREADAIFVVYDGGTHNFLQVLYSLAERDSCKRFYYISHQLGILKTRNDGYLEQSRNGQVIHMCSSHIK
jgi:hypothetical protein